MAGELTRTSKTWVGMASLRLLSSGVMLITSESLTVALTDNGHVQTLGVGATDSEVGAAVRDALGQSELFVDPPTKEEWDRIGRDTLKAGGVRSWAALERGTKLVHAHLHADGMVEVKPTKRHGKTYGGSDQPPVFTMKPTDAELGRSVHEALARSS